MINAFLCPCVSDKLQRVTNSVFKNWVSILLHVAHKLHINFIFLELCRKITTNFISILFLKYYLTIYECVHVCVATIKEAMNFETTREC